MTKPFPYSSVVDEDGMPMPVFHGTRAEFEIFSSKLTVDGGFHFGTFEQANMRSSGPGKRIIKAYIDVRKPRRSKDVGGNWRGKIRAAKSAGFDAIVYLNRFEGLTTDVIQRITSSGADLDAMSDAQFKKLVPEARDSWIVFEPSQIRIAHRNILERDSCEEVDVATRSKKTIRPR